MIRIKSKNVNDKNMDGLQRRATYDEAVMASMTPEPLKPPNREASVIINSPYAELLRMPYLVRCQLVKFRT